MKRTRHERRPRRFARSWKQSTIARTTFAAALLAIQLATASPNAWADCQPNEAKGRICPDQLPPIPSWRLVCAAGCFLFHPDDATEHELNRERVKLIPRLQASAERFDASIARFDVLLSDVVGQRDRSRLSELAALEARAAAEERLASAFQWGDLAIAGGAGIALGVILTLLAALAI